MKKILASLSGVVAAAVLVLTPLASAASSTVVITGDTSAGENIPGWMFNRDASTSTPYEFNNDASSIGSGSLFVKPIDGSTASNKFIAEDFAQTEIASLTSFSFDFKMAGTTNLTSYKQFYVNAYANIDNSSNFYDCRYDYVATIGSASSFTNLSFTPSTVPTTVAKRATARLASCPATLGGMPAGSYVRVFAINVGDTSASDAGLGGYLDNVVVATASDTTTYDFEPATTPINKDECKKDGWKTFNTPVFKNQGQCVAYVTSKGVVSNLSQLQF